MKTKVDFKKLVWGYYHSFGLDVELEMVNWLFKKGLEGGGYQEQHGWYRSGINQLLYGYSGNDETYHTEAFPIYNSQLLDNYIRSIFVRAFLAPCSYHGFKTKINEWREKNKINIEKYRYFNFPNQSQNEPRDSLWKISDYQGKELKRHLFHPDMTGRSHPRIIGIKFSTSGEGYFVSIEFSFWEFNYEPGWTYSVASQNEGEYIGDFLYRAKKELERITLNTDICERLKFNVENNFLDFSVKNCGNCTWLQEEEYLDEEAGRHNKTGRQLCGYMDFHGMKKNIMENPCNHLCDEWRLKNYSHYKEEPSGD